MPGHLRLLTGDRDDTYAATTQDLSPRILFSSTGGRETRLPPQVSQLA